MSSRGISVEFDFSEAPCLHTDDILLLDDGRLVEVVADVEPVIELRIPDLKDFAAFAHLLVAVGSRHVPVQILASRIRLQKQPEVETLLAGHRLKGAELIAPFEPDDGAHAEHGDGHGHDRGHHHRHHDDGHAHHRHEHGHHHHHHHDDGGDGHHHDR